MIVTSDSNRKYFLDLDKSLGDHFSDLDVAKSQIEQDSKSINYTVSNNVSEISPNNATRKKKSAFKTQLINRMSMMD